LGFPSQEEAVDLAAAKLSVAPTRATCATTSSRSCFGASILLRSRTVKQAFTSSVRKAAPSGFHTAQGLLVHQQTNATYARNTTEPPIWRWWWWWCGRGSAMCESRVSSIRSRSVLQVSPGRGQEVAVLEEVGRDGRQHA
jgi:hypothetical protein